MAASSETAGHTRVADIPEVRADLGGDTPDTPDTYHAFTNWVDDPFLFCFLDHFLIDSRVALSARDGGQFQGWDGDDLGALW